MLQVKRDWIQRIPNGLPKAQSTQTDPALAKAKRILTNTPPRQAQNTPPKTLAPPAGEEANPAPSIPKNALPSALDNQTQPETPAPRASTDTPKRMPPAWFEPPPLQLAPHVRAEQAKQKKQARETELQFGMASSAFALEGPRQKALSNRFARMAAKIAEDAAGQPIQGDEHWDMVEMAQRRLTGRLPFACRMEREKQRVVVVLDTSPSCAQQAYTFCAVAEAAESLGDCEIYEAPNFVLTAKKQQRSWVPLPHSVNPDDPWPFAGRVVLAFGDFDGLMRICKTSQTKGIKLHWFCCEERLEVLRANTLALTQGYKGRYFATRNIPQLLKAMGRVKGWGR